MLTVSRRVLGSGVGVLVGLVVGAGLMGLTSVALALGCGVLVGVVSGGLVDYHARTQREQVRAAVGDVSRVVEVAAYRATRRGSVPGEPEVVEAAVRIARYQLALVPPRRTLVALIPLGLLVVPTALLNASGQGDFALVIAVLCATSLLCAIAVVGQVVWLPLRLRERLRLLGVDEGVERAGAGGSGS